MKWIRRLTILGGVSLALCAITWGVVGAVSRARPHRRERNWTRVDWASLPVQVGGQLLLVGIAAVVGRKILKLKL